MIRGTLLAALLLATAACGDTAPTAPAAHPEAASLDDEPPPPPPAPVDTAGRGGGTLGSGS